MIVSLQMELILLRKVSPVNKGDCLLKKNIFLENVDIFTFPYSVVELLYREKEKSSFEPIFVSSSTPLVLIWKYLQLFIVVYISSLVIFSMSFPFKKYVFIS